MPAQVSTLSYNLVNPCRHVLVTQKGELRGDHVPFLQRAKAIESSVT